MSSSYSVDQVKWSKLDIFNQMGNIYSEVGRSFKTINNPTSNEHKQAIARAIDLFDATALALRDAKSPKLKEVLIAKEQYLQLVTKKNADSKSIKSLDNYFLQFAIAARLSR